MGLYRREGTKFYWFSYQINGRRFTETTKTTNRKLAERIYAKRLADLAEGKGFLNAIPSKVTMSEVLDRYMKEVSPTLSPSTDFRNSQIVKNLKAFFGDTLIQDVHTSNVSTYKANCLEKGFSKETILRELGLFRRVFNLAIKEWALCTENPVPQALKTLGKADNKRVRYLSAEELRQLTAALPGWLKPIVTLARHTGLRRSNIVNLTWSQVDFARKVIIIPRTKNGSPIGIPLTQTAIDTLADVQKTNHTASPYVFCDKDGKPPIPINVSKAFERAAKRAKVKDLRFHDLRHDFASSLVQSGVPIQIVKELLGHSDLRMTIRYSHLAPENLRDAVKTLDSKEKCYISATVEGGKG